MLHECNIKTTFRCPIPGRLFNIHLYNTAGYVATLKTGVKPNTYNSTISNIDIIDAGDYKVRVINANNELDYKESKAFIIHKKLRVGNPYCKLGSRL